MMLKLTIKEEQARSACIADWLSGCGGPGEIAMAESRCHAGLLSSMRRRSPALSNPLSTAES